MPERNIDIANKRFNRLLVIEKKHKNKHGAYQWLCVCDCGNKTYAASSDLKSGKKKSCGCMVAEKARINNYIHGHATEVDGRTPTYVSWRNMINRCSREYEKSFKYYGAKGIKVCDEWLNSFEQFLSDMGERPDGCTLDRKDNEKDYCPENCIWSSLNKQARNKGMQVNNKSGYKNVHWRKNRWVVVFKWGGKSRYFGSFTSLDDAAKAAKEGREIMEKEYPAQ